jgi:hypothetical protein
MRRIRAIAAAVLVLMVLAGGVVGAAAAPEGQMTWGIHVTLVPHGSIRPRRPVSSRRSC